MVWRVRGKGRREGGRKAGREGGRKEGREGRRKGEREGLGKEGEKEEEGNMIAVLVANLLELLLWGMWMLGRVRCLEC